MLNRKHLTSVCLTAFACCLTFSNEAYSQVDPIAEAQRIGKSRKILQQQPDGLYIAEAEEFQTIDPVKTSGWTPQRFGQNYYAATFANAFLSRKAFLGAPAQCDATIASLDVQIAEAGR